MKSLYQALRGRTAARERGGSLVVVLMITTALLGGAGVAMYVQLSDTRSVALVRESRAALYCAEAGLSAARNVFLNNTDEWNDLLDNDAANDAAWYPVTGDMGDGGATDFSVTIIDNVDEAGANNVMQDSDNAIFIVSTCTRFPNAPAQVLELVSLTGGGHNYRAQGGCGAGNTGNCN